MSLLLKKYHYNGTNSKESLANLNVWHLLESYYFKKQNLFLIFIKVFKNISNERTSVSLGFGDLLNFSIYWPVKDDAKKLKRDKTFEIFKNGNTTGIFQFSSDGMRSHLKNLKPDKFDDLIAMNALYRPGPMEYIPNL